MKISTKSSTVCMKSITIVDRSNRTATFVQKQKEKQIKSLKYYNINCSNLKITLKQHKHKIMDNIGLSHTNI